MRCLLIIEVKRWVNTLDRNPKFRGEQLEMNLGDSRGTEVSASARPDEMSPERAPGPSGRTDVSRRGRGEARLFDLALHARESDTESAEAADAVTSAQPWKERPERREPRKMNNLHALF